MSRYVDKILFSALLSTFCVPAYALTTATLSGPKYLDPETGPSLRTRIYNAFDLAYVTANPSGVQVGSTFLDRDPAYPNRPLTSLTNLPKDFMPNPPQSYVVQNKASDATPIKDRLQDIANKGYTHIQISSPCQAVPTVRTQLYNGGTPPFPNGINDTWPLAYAPYICNLSYAPGATSPGTANSGGAYAQGTPYYQTELTDAQSVTNTVRTDLSRYGVNIGNSANPIYVGFRLGSDRYGSAKDLATLVKSAHAVGLKVIADVVLHQIAVQSNNFSPLTHKENGTDNQCPFYAIKCYLGHGVVNGAATGQPVTSQYNPVHNSGPIDYYNVYPNAYWALTQGTNPSISTICLNSQTTAGRQPSGGATNFIIPFNPLSPSLWNFGPLLNLKDSTVQTMVRGYLQLLADIGIDGIRLDAIKDIVVPSLDNEGIGVIDAILGPFKSKFSFGYGEAFDGYVRSPDLAIFGPVIPVEDFPLHYALSSCFVGSDGKGTPISNLIMPQGIGNTPASTFSVIHDLYPMVGTVPPTEFYGNSLNAAAGYPDGNPDDGFGKTMSQLATGYLCAKRDGSPYILRFEDERDSATLIQRALAFRTLMEQAGAPHEYMVDLSRDVLLIARQFGFAVINKGDSNYTLTNADLSNVPGVYIPNGTYDEVLGLNPLSGEQTTQTTRTVETTSNIQVGSGSLTATGSVDKIFFRNARFFALRNPPSASTSVGTVTFEVNNATTKYGQQVGVLGNHPLLGNWTIRPDLLNGLLNQVDASTTIYPKWRSIPISFPKDLPISYKFVRVNPDGRTIDDWETGADRTLLKVPVGDYTIPLSDYRGTNSVSVTITVNSAYTIWGQNIYLIGSSPELGNWDTTKAILMNPNSYPAWTVNVPFSSNFPIEYKYIKKGVGSVIWFSGNNLKLNTGTSNVTNTWS